MNGQMNERTDKRTDEWTDRQTDEQPAVNVVGSIVIFPAVSTAVIIDSSDGPRTKA